MAENKESQLLKKTAMKWKIILAASITLAAGFASFYSFSQLKTQPNSQLQSSSVASPQTTPGKVAVTALGRLQPKGKITYLSAPNSINGVRVEKLLIAEGDEVKQGQILAYLDDYARSKTAIKQAFDKLLIAKSKLTQVKAGAKPGDINAQKATVTRLDSQLKGDIAAQVAAINRIQAEVNNAQTESDRYQQLYKDGAVSASIADSRALQLKITQQQLTEAKASLIRTQDTLKDQIKEANARLNSIKEVRSVDVQLAESEVKSANTAIQQAKADHDLTYIKSPIDARVLKIHAKNGEVIATSGFAELGKISEMNVIAEVYQTDIQKVRVGQKAMITSPAFPDKIQGTVKEVGWQVDKQSIFSINPYSDTDRRIIEVKISIDSPADIQKVSRFTNLQVDVAIQI
ncbi:ABC exporter membrane fusion protein [Anabaena cylindrica FACHB-243]|uniref:ABC exporter membrane fusion protein, DevB family n=1 Tax=Anabaena cylindrica (strain ATCC 27899 / PCC 7122) TaxID=272123 RepID=K9ZIH1_ANACC|nr:MULTISPECIES: ABC exporter membrane fusion protein [Anabaena]AFZ58564.1 ABC exporter membrane fusion protein, DevB family [Anabaena cylindrica PCC 7122]MBD2416326.1 ABC exporter membrane fusion protein [Anabaena cylindrica FACHB-243]MBY5283904.1 ABC exporter membrane fusion protein [Anabaena sp. CCAP 1446/1C]MBY5306720.1 ABC exporter membrane fusion protein [Anabaena sp. CCAP 1446/1C]MCM2407293.1 ABC exporter membrane fusion protein [Anabaena sp. CCAP 1446/1C]